ncbi:hypothetical protein [Stygiolobus caldivivus]|uniref:Uncharacterized protein n=1 Tax=Stygiolobus caldivivus TaxID=2824673 RepID=A0A8D5U7T0_9CREN|nr:hypothetical protein [Stygiolobus caldivivus]BCU70908.1 hypothetical protein KN1_22050 [Stygiolobus caldivivus]
MRTEDIERMRELAIEYDKLLNRLLNELQSLVRECLALELDDTLSPVFAVENVKTENASLALPYKCGDRAGYIVVTKDGKVFFEDLEGNVEERGVLSDQESG